MSLPFTVSVATLLLLGACASGKGSVDGAADTGEEDIGNADDIADLCAEGSPETLQLRVDFPATEPGCDWGEAGNMERENGVITARVDQLSALELPADAVICDVLFDFEGISGGQGTPMVYDDNFLFTFNDVVLAGSYGPMVEEFELVDDYFRQYQWADIRGYPFEFDNDIPTYCIGEAEGLADCEIPPPETEGLMSLRFDPEIVTELSFRALEEERYEFTFITMGDNDDSDCFHEDFSFLVDVPYIQR
jgi:hypothetical protein